MSWNEIQEKYPKAYKIFIKWLRPHMIAYYNTNDLPELPFAYQVGLLEEFFDERGIIALADHRTNSKGEGYWLAIVNGDYVDRERYHEAARSFAQKIAFELAFSTLESKLP